MTSLKSFPRQPSVALTTLKFSTPRDIGLKYGQRLYGYFVPPETGNYVFAVSCTNECDLALSKSDKEEKKEVILSRPKVGPEDVSSEPIPLKGGYTYFIEGLSVHGKGDSPMKVGVRLPSSKILAPIPSKHLKTSRGGLVDEEYDQIGSATLRSLFNKDTFPDQPSRFYSLDDFNIADVEGSGNHGHRIKGYYLATETGKHQFFASCASGCRLYLGKDDSCDKRTILFDYKYKSKKFIKRSSILNPWINLTNNTAKRSKAKMKTVTGTQRWLRPETMFDMSKPVDLESGLYYYIEAIHTSKGEKVDQFRVGVVPPSNKTQYPIKKEHLQQFEPNKHGVVREMWRQIKGDDIHDLQRANGFPKIPSQVDLLNEFEMPTANRYNYGQRLRGYFVAPMSGEYRFVMSCDKKCELWLSTSSKQEHKRRMLQLNKAAPKRTFNKYPSQQVTIPIPLSIGQEYYIEALHKASFGVDHLSVGVTLPNGKNEWPIPKKYIRFRPHRDGFSSHLNVPCKYDYGKDTGSKQAISKSTLNGDGGERVEGDIQALIGDLDELKDAPQPKHVYRPTKAQQGYQQTRSYADEYSYDQRDYTSQQYNDMDGEWGRYEQPQQRQNVEFYIERRDAGGKKNENAVAKVKITHLELPFGKTDPKTADAALAVLNKLDAESKKKIKIIRGKSGGFTLSGLPASLSEKEVNQIAKGLASVMENKKKKNDAKNEDSPKKSSKKKKKSKNKKGPHKVSKMTDDEETDGSEEDDDDEKKAHYAKEEEEELTTTHKTDKAEDKDSKESKAAEKQEDDSKEPSEKQVHKEEDKDDGSKEESKFSSKKPKPKDDAEEESKFSTDDKEDKEDNSSKVSLSKGKKHKDDEEEKASLNKDKKNDDEKEENSSKGNSKVSLHKEKKDEEKESSSKVSFHEETRNKDQEEGSSKDDSKFNKEKGKDDKDDEKKVSLSKGKKNEDDKEDEKKVSLNKGRKNEDEEESSSKVSLHKERKDDDKDDKPSKIDSKFNKDDNEDERKVSLNKGKKNEDEEEESSSKVSLHKERKDDDKEDKPSKIESKYNKDDKEEDERKVSLSKGKKNEDKEKEKLNKDDKEDEQKFSKEDGKVSFNKEAKGGKPPDKDDPTSSPSKVSSAVKEGNEKNKEGEKDEKNKEGAKDDKNKKGKGEDSDGGSDPMLQKAIEKLKANFKSKGHRQSKLPDDDSKEEANKLQSSFSGSNSGRLDLQEMASHMLDTSGQKPSPLDIGGSKPTMGVGPSLAISQTEGLDSQVKQQDMQLAAVVAAAASGANNLRPLLSMNLPSSFKIGDDEQQIKPTVYPNVVPLSHSLNQIHPITNTPWQSWGHVYDHNLVHGQEIGGGSHQGVGLPDTGQGSLVSPLSNKEPFIESVSVIGNAMNIRPTTTGGQPSEVAPDPVASLTAKGPVEPSVPTTPPQPLQQLQGGVFLGGDSVGAPVSDTIPGSIVAVGNEQPPGDKAQVATQSSTAQPQVVGQPADLGIPGVGQSTSIVQQPSKSYALSRLNEFDILDVDLDGINRLNKNIFRNSIPQNELRSKISRIKRAKTIKRHKIPTKKMR